MVAVGGFRWQREIEPMATLRLIAVHNTNSLDQLWGERDESWNQCCSPSLGPGSQGPNQQSTISSCHSQGQASTPVGQLSDRTPAKWFPAWQQQHREMFWQR